MDTTGNFDVLRLFTLIIARLLSCQQSQDLLAPLRESVGLGSDSRAEDVAAKVLDRVKIMRVFDFEGVREAVGEIRDELEGRGGGGKDTEEKEEALAKEQVRVGEAKETSKRTFVPDSEGEDEDEEEEMLFESEAEVTSAKEVQQSDKMSVSKREQTVPPDTPKHDSDGIPENNTPGTLKFILIDNLAQVLGPLLKQDLTQGSFFFLFSSHTVSIHSPRKQRQRERGNTKSLQENKIRS